MIKFIVNYLMAIFRLVDIHLKSKIISLNNTRSALFLIKLYKIIKL